MRRLTKDEHLGPAFATTWPQYELDGQTRALLAYASKLTQAPTMVDDTDIAALRAAGWDEREIYEPPRSSRSTTSAAGSKPLRDCRRTSHRGTGECLGQRPGSQPYRPTLERERTVRREEDCHEDVGQGGAGHGPVRRARDGARAGHLAPRPRQPRAHRRPAPLLHPAVRLRGHGLRGGVAFLLFGFRPLLRLAWGARPRAWALYLSIGWSLVSWWPHDTLHAHNGMALQGLLYIEYGFHVTLIIAAFVLALSLLTLLRPGGDADFEPVAGAAPVVGERTAA